MAHSRSVRRKEQREEYEHDPTNARQTWQALRDDLLRVGSQWLAGSSGTVDVEERLHEIWDELIHAAKVLPAASSEHDRMLTLILELRELGVLTRSKDCAAADALEGIALMPNGQRLWTDLPYLVQEFQEFWLFETTHLSATERESISVLTAKLCATGVCSAELAICGLWLLKETLETDRPMFTSSSASSPSENSPLPILELLPACAVWLSCCNHKLARFSADNYNARDWQVSDDGRVDTLPGPLAARSDITQPGFSIKRWLFWRQRLGELYLSENPHVSQLARKGFEAMVGTGLAIGISIPGEKTYLMKLFEALDQEIAALNYEACVHAKYIKIDPSWAIDDQ